MTKLTPSKKIDEFDQPAAGYHVQTYAEHQILTNKIASALTGAGVGISDRISTLMWNNSRHFALYHAVPCMGCVLNPLNV